MHSLTFYTVTSYVLINADQISGLLNNERIISGKGMGYCIIISCFYELIDPCNKSILTFLGICPFSLDTAALRKKIEPRHYGTKE